ncbi:hypothetical protein IQ265_06520 [Nodosilinea sp. LEGE 06152]|uniref:hypothetical protein n=1 Tax=Nodosilinea sp. LEGE 06152 TaxID=2777966 RepID=UPI001881B3C3|nr:hypothetical protein [Nodosilinea sp. LEGE 06152]MBE9156483.1 hypothetical protein [Nodosilinea sp. LEGE 06152]
MQTVEKIAIDSSPKATLESLQSTIAETQEKISSLQSRLKNYEISGNYALIQSENIPVELSTLKSALDYYQAQLPIVQAKVDEFEKLEKRDKALMTLQSAESRLQDLTSQYNDAREQLISASKQLNSLDRQLSGSIATVRDSNFGSIYPISNEFLGAEEIPLISLKTLENIPQVFFHQERR